MKSNEKSSVYFFVTNFLNFNLVKSDFQLVLICSIIAFAVSFPNGGSIYSLVFLVACTHIGGTIPAGIVRKSASNVNLKKAVKKSASNAAASFQQQQQLERERLSSSSRRGGDSEKMQALKKKYVEQRLAKSVLESRTLTRSQTTAKSPPSKADKAKQKVQGHVV